MGLLAFFFFKQIMKRMIWASLPADEDGTPREQPPTPWYVWVVIILIALARKGLLQRVVGALFPGDDPAPRAAREKED